MEDTFRCNMIEDYRRFGGTCILYHQVKRRWASNYSIPEPEIYRTDF